MKKEGKTMYKVISEFRAGKYAILKLDKKIMEIDYHKYRIEGKDYDIVPVYDLPNHIAVESSEDFVGKTVEFI